MQLSQAQIRKVQDIISQLQKLAHDHYDPTDMYLHDCFIDAVDHLVEAIPLPELAQE